MALGLSMLCSLAVGMVLRELLVLGLSLLGTVELRKDEDILTRAGFLLYVP